MVAGFGGLEGCEMKHIGLWDWVGELDDRIVEQRRATGIGYSNTDTS